MAKKLYIGNLSYDTTDESLREAFAKAGNVVSATVITDKMSGRSRGFGFVEMEKDEEATAAIEMWNDKDLDGRTLAVNEARPMTPRSSGGFDRGGRDRGFGGGNRQNNRW